MPDILPRHGGDLDAAGARWGRPAQGWLDLSTGINPHPYPLPPLAPEAWTRLPGQEALEALLKAAGRCYGASAGTAIVAAPGTQALIGLLPRLLPRARVAVLGPTYGEHAAAWARAGHRVREVSAMEEAEGAGIVVLVNPNNPDGRLVPLAGIGARKGLVVVDEAFADLAPAASVVPFLRRGLVVLRSFGKFYGLPGLRLGFALGDAVTIGRLSEALGPWAVPGPALAIGRAALEDEGWAGAMRARLADEVGALDGVLASAGLEIEGGTALFRLVRHAQASRIYDRLGRAGILVRAFADRPEFLRIGLPGSAAGLVRLEAALCGESGIG